MKKNFWALSSMLWRGHGFELKPNKTRFLGHGSRMEVTGVVINEKLQPPRRWRKRTRARLHQLGNARRLVRKDVAYLQGIQGISRQFPDSPNMCAYAEAASSILERLSRTVIGRGNEPILPRKLTIRQAEVLASLVPRRSNAEIAIRLSITEAAVKKRLQGAFRKIEVRNRKQALQWATKNL